MKTLTKVLLVALLVMGLIKVALAAPSPVDATASITCTVAEIMEWSGNFSTIALADITTQTSAPTSSETTTLYTNGDVSITADTTGTEAQLAMTADPNQTLVTSYQLRDAGDGSTTTGGTDESSYTGYATFISGGYAITHVAGDGEDVITLYAQAENPAGEVADAGDYTALQTLTATWVP